MKYQQGNMGRVFLARVEHGENPLEELRKLAKKEEVSVAVFFVLGALKSAAVVTGPREPVIPPVPNRVSFDDGREILGIGTIIPGEEKEPQLHLHGVIGREEKALLGCLRNDAETYLLLEVVILELLGIKALKELETSFGLKTLQL